MKYHLREGHWTEDIIAAIKEAKSGDIIICPTEAKLELGKRAWRRMAPEKQLLFRLEDSTCAETSTYEVPTFEELKRLSDEFQVIREKMKQDLINLCKSIRCDVCGRQAEAIFDGDGIRICKHVYKKLKELIPPNPNSPQFYDDFCGLRIEVFPDNL